ncbi:4'-phosphopantetheinyl transferase family protein [Motilimonas pumila]|uniref:Enterobactin synthase component D n=1 Tax=Motilimonas pumila TaxID=2303987 RepID=A0A418YFU8_9GAMM|nr:4'-phosphopantetheinyl transferase superfamily protein [Motilimonas pumila]RJG48179.1 4'-phosphopantetheinyl transferase superfamily protein [Motilimonas pumila]
MTQLTIPWPTLLPANATFAQATPEMWLLPLSSLEEACIANAVAKRKAEFRAGRHALKLALKHLGANHGDIVVGHMRQPVVDPSLVVSISHCQRNSGPQWQGFAGAICAKAKPYYGVGLDIEFNTALEPALVAQIMTPAEQNQAAKLGLPAALIFCIKESIYKACFNEMQCYFDFLDVEVTLRAEENRFSFRFVHSKIGFPRPYDFEGRFFFNQLLCVSTATMKKHSREAGEE